MRSIMHTDDSQLKIGLRANPGAGEAHPAAELPGGGTAEECRGAVRLRRPERREMAMVVKCPDDRGPPGHPVRRVAAVVEHLDGSAFCQPLKAREGGAGRDATDPQLLVSLWLYACVRGIGSARELARQCQEHAPFRWLCGGVSVNHHLLSDFRTAHGEALDQLLTQVIASLVDQDVVKVSRISQDGMRVRVGAGASSFRREARLQKLLEEAQRHVAELHQQLDSPASAGAAVTAKQAAARKRAAREKQERLEQAIGPLREQVEQRAGGKVEEHLVDGGYLRRQDMEEAHAQGVALYVPPKPARNPQRRGQELEPRAGDSEAVRAWKQRMASAEGKEIYKQRAATSETVNADLRTWRGLGRLTVRGLAKARCVALWCALAYNIMHFSRALLA